MNTCDTCRNYNPLGDDYRPNLGMCKQTCDYNELTRSGENEDPTRAYAWDYEGYSAGVFVGAKFGCIHWMVKE